MITIPGKIPISIHPFFWLTMFLIGLIQGQGSLVFAFIFGMLGVFSILVHEFGHALTALFFGKKPEISLFALGGVTRYDGRGLSLFRQFLIVLNGPLAGLSLSLFSLYLSVSFRGVPFTYGILFTLFVINLFWTAINLLPILPLDGGQLLRIILEAIFGFSGVKAVFVISTMLASFLAGYSFLKSELLIGAILFVFAFENYQSFCEAREVAPEDHSEEVKKKFHDAEDALQQGKKMEAIRNFEEIGNLVQEGLLFKTAMHYLGLLYYSEGRKQEAYEALLKTADSLDKEGILLLHELAYDAKNYDLVAKLSTKCFQTHQKMEVALRSAKAFGALGNGKFAGGWLQSAYNLSPIDVECIIKEEPFLPVKNDPSFQSFVQKMR